MEEGGCLEIEEGGGGRGGCGIVGGEANAGKEVPTCCGGSGEVGTEVGGGGAELGGDREGAAGATEGDVE